MIFGQGFLPLALDISISNCRAPVLILVHTGYFIFPVPTISGERSPLRHLGRRPIGNWQLLTGSVEKQRGMAFGFRKTATAVKNPHR